MVEFVRNGIAGGSVGRSSLGFDLSGSTLEGTEVALHEFEIGWGTHWPMSWHDLIYFQTLYVIQQAYNFIRVVITDEGMEANKMSGLLSENIASNDNLHCCPRQTLAHLNRTHC